MYPWKYQKTILRLAMAIGAVALTTRGAYAYPEFQRYSQQVSGRFVNCAMCHVHPDGPMGLKPGQIGKLSPEELNQLNRARGAFEPGQDVSNPILNDFGNALLKKLGKKKILELRLQPEQLADAYGYDSDIDGDGIADAREFLQGTHPADPEQGNPWALFTHNLQRYAFPHLFLLIVATALGLFGLNNLLHWFHGILQAGDESAKH